MLLVEDDETMRLTLTFLFKKAQYTVTAASNGNQALHFLDPAQHDAVPYDIVLTDIQLGKVDGIQVMHAALAHPSSPAVILLTGYASVDTAIAALRSGAHDYLQKPCSNEDILECVARALEQRHTQLQQAQAIETLTRTVMQLQDTSSSQRSVHRSMHVQSHHQLPGTEHRTANVSNEHEHPPSLSLDGLHIDYFRHEISLNGKRLHLTPHEYALLSYLAQTCGRVVDPCEIVRHTHNLDVPLNEARLLLKSHIRNLRQKLPVGYLITVRGKGYMLVLPDDMNTV
jgi:DNA-binding response OmpR family regulator